MVGRKETQGYCSRGATGLEPNGRQTFGEINSGGKELI